MAQADIFPAPSPITHSRISAVFLLNHDITVLVHDVLHVLDVLLHLLAGHGVNLQQHGVGQPVRHFLVRQNLVVKLL